LSPYRVARGDLCFREAGRVHVPVLQTLFDRRDPAFEFLISASVDADSQAQRCIAELKQLRLNVPTRQHLQDEFTSDDLSTRVAPDVDSQSAWWNLLQQSHECVDELSLPEIPGKSPDAYVAKCSAALPSDSRVGEVRIVRGRHTHARRPGLFRDSRPEN